MCYSLWYNAPMMLPAGNIVGADNEIYLLIKFIKSVHWRVAKYLSDIEEARCLKVNKYMVSGDKDVSRANTAKPRTAQSSAFAKFSKSVYYRDADKFLARPGRKKATATKL